MKKFALSPPPLRGRVRVGGLSQHIRCLRLWHRPLSPALSHKGRGGSGFLRAQHGSALPIVALGAMMLIGATGTAVDMGRMQIVQSRMQNALDATGLAVGSEISTINLPGETSKYFYANFPATYLGTTVTALTATPNSDNTVINLTAAGTVPTSFMQLFGISTMPISAATEITRQSKGMELVLVLDGTGTMNDAIGGGATKISALRAAANSLVNILYGSKTSIDNLWIGIVPFAQAVNVGNSHTDWVTADSYNYAPVTWDGCVEARETNGRDITEDPPSVAKFPRYFSACVSYSASWTNAWYGNNTSTGNPNYSNCSKSTGWQYRTPLSNTTRSPNQYCPLPVTRMTRTKSDITAAINLLQAGAGDTHINLGMVWGWRMLSQQWQDKWGGDMDTYNLPLNYDTPLMTKVALLLSDGDNHYIPNNYTAYGTLSQSRLGTNKSYYGGYAYAGSAEEELDERTLAVCNSMKAKHILIYTIALGTSISSTGKNLLKNCATKTEYYFESPDNATLQTAFKTIGDSLANLRISK